MLVSVTQRSDLLFQNGHQDESSYNVTCKGITWLLTMFPTYLWVPMGTFHTHDTLVL